MSKISAVCGKSQIFTIEGIPIEFKSNFITIDDLPTLLLLTGEEQGNLSVEEKTRRGEAIRELVFRILKKAIPDATDEEIKEFGLRNLKEIMEAIVKISGLTNVK
jgi:hypothetical protein